nr:single-stranded DNA-binding protein [Treponema denticola]
MKSLNSLIIEGNIVRDPVLKTTANGTDICTFSIASNRNYKKDDAFVQETSYFDVESWASLAKLCEQNGAKGRGVRVVGRIKQDRWVGTDGKNYSKVKVVAEHVEFKPIFKNAGEKTQAKEEVLIEEKVMAF